MGILAFDTWAARFIKSMPLSSLNESVIGVDASYYLERLLAPSKEPLLSALGGYPLALEASIANELRDLQSSGLKLHFVFNGLDFGVKDDPFRPSVESARANATAFEIYEKDMASEAIRIFKTSGAPTPAAMSEFLKEVLHKHGVEFTVAPYSALAQLAYYEKDPNQFIDAIYGPSELFLYNVDKFITKWDFAYEQYETFEKDVMKNHTRVVVEDSKFYWIDRRTCIEELGNIPMEVFTDACFLAGSSLLRTFPPLENPTVYSKAYTIRDVIALIMSCGRSVTAVCAQYQDDVHVKELDYLDRYKKTATAVRHHVVITKDGNVVTLDAEHAPSDVHDCIGQRLPEELDMYLFRGMLRPRILNWLTSGTILITAPYDGGSSLEYQNLVKTQLEPWRKQALCLLADSVHRYYQRKEVTTKVWFEPEADAKFNLPDLLPSPKESLRTWHVNETLIESKAKRQAEGNNCIPGTLYYAVRTLTDSDFAAKTITPKSSSEPPLQTPTEITTNVIWRFLQLRGYVDAKHQLTAWGNVLNATMKTLGPNTDQEEAAYLGVEIMRLGLLNPSTMFPNFSGAPMYGTVTDRRNCMLVSRVACLGKLRHQPKGYSGPLSRHLLAYHSIVSAVHAGLRDLVEMSLATMFLDGHVNRERDDWMDLSLSLPFHSENSCALAIATKTYLDELSLRDDPNSESARAETKEKGQGWVINSEFKASLNDAFHLWDAVYKGVQIAGEKVTDGRMWDDVDQWLTQRR